MDFSSLTKEELIKLAQKQEQELKNKKYGLVWDREKVPEKVVVDCDKSLPILKEIKKKEIKENAEDDTTHIMIKGDNFHSLSALNTTHKSQIKCIYIDPPYNTEKEGFIYNDRFIDKEDGYRHSKWINFMYSRLQLAKELLSDDGVILISIDDNEHSNLRLLCDKIFGAKNLFLNGIVNKASQIASSYTISMHEYFLVYSKNIDEAKVISSEKYTISRGTVGNIDQTMPVITFPKGLKCKNIKDGIYLKTRKVKGSSENIENLDKIIVKNGVLDREVRLKAKWRSSNDMRNFFKNNCMPTKAKISGTIEEIYFENDKFNPQIKKKTLDKMPSMFCDNKRGSKDLETLGLKNKFDNPKFVGFIRKMLYYTTGKNDIVLDFFAGSGTTGQAVLELNKEDGGNRKFILCSNNENNIFDDVCYTRVSKIVKGYKKNGDGEFAEGLGGNVKIYETDFVKNSKYTEVLKNDFTIKATEMFCIKENAYNQLDDTESFKIFENNRQNKLLGIYFDFKERNLDNFIKTIKSLKHKDKACYVFSEGVNVPKLVESSLKDVEIVPVPENFLNAYKRIIKDMKK